MEENSPKRIKEYWAEFPRIDEDFLGSIRNWKNVQIATDDEIIWLRGFTEEQAVSAELMQLPNFLLYELRDGFLFRTKTLVPSKKIRTGLLWLSIHKALKLNLPPSNQNFFGIDGKIEVHLKPSEEEQPAVALLCSMNDIKEMLVTLPKFRLEKISWIVINDKALFMGNPLLSFPGKTFWLKNDHFLPTGFDFEFKNVSTLLQKKYNEEQNKWLLWNEDGSVLFLDKEHFRALSISSFRLTEKSEKWI